MKVLVTGGLGFIGSHLVIQLVKNNYDVVIIDNLYNSKKKTHKRLEVICKRKITLYVDDLKNISRLNNIFASNQIDCVIHLAGYKSVSESMKYPKKYFVNNFYNSSLLIKAMKQNNIKKLLFSSSATVYGKPTYLPIDENHALKPVNFYGKSKLMVENMLINECKDEDFKICSLRYFNPIGSHNNGEFGEDAVKNSDNLIPQILNTIFDSRKTLNVYGSNFQTSDGSAVRDYIHITDLITGHLKALEKINDNLEYKAYNLGTGKGISVLEVIGEFERILNINIKKKICEKRHGDIAEYYCDPTKANIELNWKCVKNLNDMCNDSYLWRNKLRQLNANE